MIKNIFDELNNIDAYTKLQSDNKYYSNEYYGIEQYLTVGAFRFSASDGSCLFQIYNDQGINPTNTWKTMMELTIGTDINNTAHLFINGVDVSNPVRCLH